MLLEITVLTPKLCTYSLVFMKDSFTSCAYVLTFELKSYRNHFKNNPIVRLPRFKIELRHSLAFHVCVFVK